MTAYFEFLRHPQPLLREHNGTLALYFGGDATQSLMCRRRPFDLELVYTRTMMGFLLFQSAPLQILMIGLGGGSLVKFCHRHLPQARLTVVEINPHVIALREQFLIPADDDRLKVLQVDGAEFLSKLVGPFDVVMVDGFDDNGACAELGSEAFYRHCHACLNEDGVLVVNLDTEHAEHQLWLQRIGAAFQGNSVAIGIPDRRNCIAFAGKGAVLAASDVALERVMQALPNAARAQLQPELRRIVEFMLPGAVVKT